MRVLMPWKDKPKTGKGKFFQRLAQAFPRVGVTPVHDPAKDHDAYLDYNSFKMKSSKPKILRLNGVYHDKAKPYKKMNAEIKKQVKKADAVIYQSKFCRDMHERYVGLLKPYSIIYNGSMKGAATCLGLNDDFVIAFARWRPHKRLKDIKKSAKMAGVRLIVFDGEQNEAIINNYLIYANAAIHLSWIDWCPNSVIEALIWGCPVITNNVGGTQELIKDGCGKALNLDDPYDMKPIKLYEPPPIDHNKVAETIVESLKWPRVTNNFHIDIINIATQYRDFISEVCGIR